MSHLKRRLALVIGSGSVKCAAALGLWRALQQEEIELDLVIGCSGGSLYAAGIALADDLDEFVKNTTELWTADVMSGFASNLRAAMARERPFDERSGLVDDDLIWERLKAVYGERTFADATIPLYVVATDFYSGERVVLTGGRLADAIRASIAIPMIFAPWEVEGRLLTDGAVADPLPIDVAIKEGAHVIVSMGFELTLRRRMRSFHAVQSHLNAVYMNNILRSTFAFYNAVHHAEIVPIWPDFGADISSFDVDKIPYIIKMGEEAAAEHVPYLRKLLQSEEGP